MYVKKVNDMLGYVKKKTNGIGWTEIGETRKFVAQHKGEWKMCVGGAKLVLARSDT